MLKQNILAMSLICTCSITFGQNEWILPKGYTKPYGTTANGYFYSVEEKNNSIYFIIGYSEEKVFFPWVTKCSKLKPKGILETTCVIEPMSSNDHDPNMMTILLNQNRSFIVFKPIESVENHYKIDSQPTVSLENNYVLNERRQRNLIGDLERGKKITYSFKKTNISPFDSRTHDLSGIGYHLDFSKETLRLNN